MIAIVDYGMGNVRSIQNMLRRLGAQSNITADSAELERADALILPGVGAFDEGIRRLDQLGLRTLLDRLVIAESKPVLGICLGMQLLTRASEEGSLPGLGWIDATTRRIEPPTNAANYKVPHMGWNFVVSRTDHPLLADLESARFYFVHSYHVCCAEQADVLATTEYGYPFTSAVAKNHILGTQFHPEKSHKFGMALLKNFVRIVSDVSCARDALPVAG